MTTDASEPTLRASLGNLTRSLTNTVNKLITLGLLEGRLAGISLVNLVGLALIACFLLFAAWLSLMFAITLLLVWSGFHLLVALLITAGLNLCLLIPVIGLMMRFYRNLRFPATRRQLEISKLETKGLVQ